MRRLAIPALSVLAAAVLSACNSTQDVLEPSAIAPPANGATPPTQDTASPGQPAPATSSVPSPTSPGQNAALVASARIQFAPIVGSSVEAATALSERLATRARERGMTLTGGADATTTHVLKGYFTPLTEGKQTTVIYVWDVYDPAGNRIHRISGQEKALSAGGDGWPSVSQATMQKIADATIEQLAVWLGGRAG